MLEFTKYPAPPPAEVDPPMCVVSYPERCGWVAEGEVWSMPFCRKHGEEAVAAARLEAYEDAGRELDALAGLVEGEHAVRNPLVYEALKGAKLPDGPCVVDHGEAIRAAYDLEGVPVDPDTLAFNYDDDSCGVPLDWWSEAREMVVGWMREAHEVGQPPLLKALEPIREYVTVQQELASRDLERRWAAPRRAEREERRKREAASEPAAEILKAVNEGLTSSMDHLDTMPAEGSFDGEAIRKAGQAIAEAGGIVAKEEQRVSVATARRRRERPEGAA